MKGKGISFSRNRNRVEPAPQIQVQDTNQNEIAIIENRIQELERDRQTIRRRYDTELRRIYDYVMEEYGIDFIYLKDDYDRTLQEMGFDENMINKIISYWHQYDRLQLERNENLNRINGEIRNLQQVLQTLRGTVARTGGGLKNSNDWINYVLKIKKKHGISYKEAMIKAKSSYRK